MLHKLLVSNPYPGWKGVSQALLEQHSGGFANAIGGGSNVAFGDWIGPDGKSQLLVVLKTLPRGFPPGLRGAPTSVKRSFANGVCKTNGGFHSTYGVVGSGLSTVGRCNRTFEGGAVTFAMATTQANQQEFFLSVGPGSLSESQLKQIALSQFQALRSGAKL
jgi:hypothetical protein